MRKLSTAFVLGVLVGACAPSVPSEPTYFDHVKPILDANCARCHGSDPFRPEIAGFRLDRYVKNDEKTFDAWDFRDAIVWFAADYHDDVGSEISPRMPLDYELSDRQKDILRAWVAAGAPKGTRENRAPSIELISRTPDPIDQSLELTYRASDEDGDGLMVALGFRASPADPCELAVGELGGGVRTATLDTGLLASKQTFQVCAIIDDGFSDDPAMNATTAVLIPDLFIDHGERGTAPSVTVLEPNIAETLIGTKTIKWSATDPDVGDEMLTIAIDLVTVDPAGNELSVASIAPGTVYVTPSLDWDTSGVPASDGSGNPIWYRIRVTATDSMARNTRSDDSDESFTIAPEVTMTNLTWADVKPTFVTYCTKCHGQPARTPQLDYFRLDIYDANEPGANGDLGVFEQRSLVYQKLIVTGAMPPAAEPQPPQAEVDKIAEWILAGAPKESGPVDGLPTFTWTTPDPAMAVQKITTGMVTLGWTAADPEMLPFMGGNVQYATVNGVVAQVSCDASITSWTTISGVDVASGSHVFTSPGNGCYCFRGAVTDAANQTTVSIGAQPVMFYSGGPGMICP